METVKNIAKEILIPYLEQDTLFLQVPGEFWEHFLKALLKYEQEPQPAFVAIYQLNLNDPEKIIRKLSEISEDFLDALAESHVLGNASEAIEKYQLLDHLKFRERVKYYENLKNAIAVVERERMITEMSVAYAAVSEEISDENISAAIQKRQRQDLKEKFETWEEEMEEEKFTFYNINPNINYSYSFPNYIKEEKEERLLLPEKAMPPERSFHSGYIWVGVIAALVMLGILIWVFLY